VRPARSRVDHTDLLQQDSIGLRAPRRWSDTPRIEAAGGDAQHAAHRGDRVHGPGRPQELEPFGGIEPGSRANQAAALFRVSRSSRRILFSRPKPLQLLALVGGQAVAAAAGVPISLSGPVADRLRGRLELLRQLLGIPPGSDEIDQPLLELRWVRLV